MDQNVFEQMAARYDTPDRKELAAVIQKEIVPELVDAKEKILVDYGSGTGLISLDLAGQVKKLILVDAAGNMLEVADAKIAKNNIKNARTLQADFTQELPDIKADIVIVSLVLLHIPDTAKILSQLFEILNPDGQLIIVDFDPNERAVHPKVHSGFDHEELRELLAKTGFHDINIRTFHHGKNIFMKQDASMFLATCVK